MSYMSDNEGLEPMKFASFSVLESIHTERDIKISGRGKLEGDIECNAFKSSGSLKGKGNITTHGNFKSSGRVELEGTILSDGDINSSGPFVVIGSVQCIGKFHNAGSTKISNSLHCGGGYHTSGPVNIGGSVQCGQNFHSSGTMQIRGKVIIDGSLNSSGALTILSFLRCANDAHLSGRTKVQEDITIYGVLRASGRIEGEFVEAKKGIELSGTTEIFNDLESDDYIKTSGKLTVEGDLLAKQVIFKDPKPKIFNIKPKGYSREIRGNIKASELVDINRTLVEKDVRGKKVIIGRYCKIIGTVYYVDECDVDETAELLKPAVKIDAEQL